MMITTLLIAVGWLVFFIALPVVLWCVVYVFRYWVKLIAWWWSYWL